MITTQALCLSAVLLGSAPDNVLLDFSASWCGPCQQMSPLVSRLERQGYPIRKIDVDQNRQLANRFGISSIPAFVLVIDGKVAERVIGPTSENRLKAMMAKIPRKQKPQNPIKSLLAGQSRSRDTANSRSSNNQGKRGFSIPFLNGNNQRHPEVPESTEPPVIRANIDNPQKHAPRTAGEMAYLATVRLRVQDGTGENLGTGTIISSQPGRTIVLTCAHVFRGSNKKTRIDVDVFRNGKPETYVGKILDYDMEADVGLMEFATGEALPIAKLAGMKNQIQRGDHVFSFGCNGGQNPTRMKMRVADLNRYQGPDNLECTGEPKLGRSGGGLYNQAGEIIGVCSAADFREHRGLYAGRKAIIKLLNRSELAHLHEDQMSSMNVATLGDDADPASLESENQRLGHRQDNILPVRNSQSQNSQGDDLENLKDSEVVCIIRPINDPQAASRVVIINRASTRFLSYLTDELNGQIRPTMHSVKKNTPEPPATRIFAPTPARPTQSKSGYQGYQRYRRSAASR